MGRKIETWVICNDKGEKISNPLTGNVWYFSSRCKAFVFMETLGYEVLGEDKKKYKVCDSVPMLNFRELCEEVERRGKTGDKQLIANVGEYLNEYKYFYTSSEQDIVNMLYNKSLKAMNFFSKQLSI